MAVFRTLTRAPYDSYLNANGGTDANSDIGNAGAALLISNITDTRTAIEALSLDKTLPIGTADAGSYFNNEVLAAVDYGMSNIHAWFANVSIDQSAAWVNEFFQETNVAAAKALSNNPTMYIAETGWPSVSFRFARPVFFSRGIKPLCSYRHLATSAMRATAPRPLRSRTSRRSWTPLSAKLTITAPATSSSSTSTRPGRTRSSVALRVTGVCSTRSRFAPSFCEDCFVDALRVFSRTLKDITIPTC